MLGFVRSGAHPNLRFSEVLVGDDPASMNQPNQPGGSDPMTVSAAIMNRIHDLIAGGMALSSVAKGISALSLRGTIRGGMADIAHNVVQLVIT
jgi:hypothetical protein